MPNFVVVVLRIVGSETSKSSSLQLMLMEDEHSPRSSPAPQRAESVIVPLLASDPHPESSHEAALEQPLVAAVRDDELAVGHYDHHEQSERRSSKSPIGPSIILTPPQINHSEAPKNDESHVPASPVAQSAHDGADAVEEGRADAGAVRDGNVGAGQAAVLEISLQGLLPSSFFSPIGFLLRIMMFTRIVCSLLLIIISSSHSHPFRQHHRRYR